MRKSFFTLLWNRLPCTETQNTKTHHIWTRPPLSTHSDHNVQDKVDKSLHKVQEFSPGVKEKIFEQMAKELQAVATTRLNMKVNMTGKELSAFNNSFTTLIAA